MAIFFVRPVFSDYARVRAVKRVNKSHLRQNYDRTCVFNAITIACILRKYVEKTREEKTREGH